MKTKTTIRVFLQVGIICSMAATFLTGSNLPGKSQAGELTITVSGIVVHDQYDRSGFFPKGWLTEPSNCNGAQISPVEEQRVIPLIEQFASSYDTHTIKCNLTDIYLLSNLTCFGKPYGGTHNATAIYIRVGTLEAGYTDQFLLSLLYAEFSSVLMRYYSFPREEWLAVNDDDFVYQNNAVKMLEQEGLRESSQELLAAGFVDRYATASIEEDFNEVSSWLFTRPQELCDTQAAYEKIERKYKLAVEFYTSIDPDIKLPNCK